MRRIRLTVERFPADVADHGRLAVYLTTDPPLEDGPTLGTLFLPVGWLKVLRTVAPVLGIVEADFALEWDGVPVDAAPDPRIGKLAKLVKKLVHLF